jgi:undecaprenyl-diphosphatase
MNELIIFGATYLIWLIVIVAGAYGLVQPRKKQKELLVFVSITLPIIYIAAKIGSLFYFDARPFVVENFVPLIAHAPDNGFPSDHTLLSAAVAMVIFFYNRKIGLVLLNVALLVGLSRMLAGVHHATDIFGSLGFAIIFAWLVHKYGLPMIVQTKIYKKYSK